MVRRPFLGVANCAKTLNNEPGAHFRASYPLVFISLPTPFNELFGILYSLAHCTTAPTRACTFKYCSDNKRLMGVDPVSKTVVSPGAEHNIEYAPYRLLQRTQTSPANVFI